MALTSTRIATSPRKLPSQSRSRETHGAILEAARQLLRTEGSEAFTMAELASRAGVSPGSLYQYFKNRTGVLEALRDEHFVDLQRILEIELPSALTEPTLTAAARRILGAMHALLARDAAVLSVVLRADPCGFSSSTTLFDAMREQLEITVRFILEERRATLGITDLEMAAVLVTRHITSTTYGTMMITPQYLGSDRFLDESVAMLIRYLGSS